MFTSRNKIKIQGKTAAHKKAMLRSQIVELIRNTKIKTTPKKSKLLKKHFDKLVTKAKVGNDHSKRQIESFFNHNNRAVERFYYHVENTLNDRNSGYTRVIRTLNRKGDNAEQVFVLITNTQATEKKSKVSEALEKQEKKKTKKKSVKKTEDKKQTVKSSKKTESEKDSDTKK